MTAARWPIWRTTPAGFGRHWVWPVLVGAVAGLVAAPLAGTMTFGVRSLIGSIAAQSGLAHVADDIALILVMSFLFSWIILLPALPLSAWLARMGSAGWGIAGGVGSIAGVIAGWQLDGGTGPEPSVLSHAGSGAVIGCLSRLAIRLFRPNVVGLSDEKGVA